MLLLPSRLSIPQPRGVLLDQRVTALGPKLLLSHHGHPKSASRDAELRNLPSPLTKSTEQLSITTTSYLLTSPVDFVTSSHTASGLAARPLQSDVTPAGAAAEAGRIVTAAAGAAGEVARDVTGARWTAECCTSEDALWLGKSGEWCQHS